MGNALNTARHAIWNDTMKGIIKKVEQTVSYDEFTDGGSTAGTLEMDDEIPAGSLVIGAKAVVTAGFDNDTSAALTIGDGTTADLWGVTMDVKTAATVGCSAKYASNKSLPFCAAATEPVLTVTGAADWGNQNQGEMTVSVYYIELN